MMILSWIATIGLIVLAVIELIVIAYLFRVAWLGRQETKRLAARLRDHAAADRDEE